MEKMTIHRALIELKMLDSRIYSAINEGTYITANRRSNIKINGNTLEDHKKVIQGSFDKVTSLIARRNKIKAAIVASNAKTIVDINGISMTVAEAIERKNSIQYDQQFLSSLKSHYVRAISELNEENEDLQRKLEVYLQSVLGNKDNAKKEDVEYHTKSFLDRNEFDLIDPLKVKDRINKMEDETQNFLAEVDATLSSSNSITFIFDEAS